MCGIAGFYIKDMHSKELPPLAMRERFVNELLLGIEPRGHHATGILAVTDKGTPRLEKADTMAETFVKWRKPLPRNTRMVLCHTRFATQGTPMNLENNHPVNYRTCFATHNGHIRNDDELFKQNELERYAEVDSEIIPALLHKHGIEKVNVALKDLDGGYALALFDSRKPDTLVLAKGPSSPLIYIETELALVWASTREALEGAYENVFGAKPLWKDMHNLYSGELILVEDGQSELLKFEVKKTVWESSYSWDTHWKSSRSHWSSYRSDSSTTPAAKKYDWTVCKCGESRYWHTGRDYNGVCVKAGCPCQSFVKDKAATKKARKERGKGGSTDGAQTLTVWEGGRAYTKRACVECGEFDKEDAMEKEAGYWFCQDCYLEDCDICFEQVPMKDMKFVPSDEEAMGNSHMLVCPKCIDAAMEPKEVASSRGDKIVVNDAAFIRAAARLGIAGPFLYWMLLDAEEADFEKESGWLVGAYETAMLVYMEEMEKEETTDDPPTCTTIPVAETSSVEHGVQVFSD